jgi:hypothetical protein
MSWLADRLVSVWFLRELVRSGALIHLALIVAFLAVMGIIVWKAI